MLSFRFLEPSFLMRVLSNMKIFFKQFHLTNNWVPNSYIYKNKMLKKKEKNVDRANLTWTQREGWNDRDYIYSKNKNRKEVGKTLWIYTSQSINIENQKIKGRKKNQKILSQVICFRVSNKETVSTTNR